MNNQDNRENNIVNPELVDLNKVQVNNQDNMLNRERSNIVSASIQANNAIDEKKALDVNNEIKLKKVNPIVKILVIIFAFILAGIGIFYAMKLVNKIMTYDDPVTTTTTQTITTPTSKIANYTNNTNIIRDTEFKAYMNKEKNKILIINGTPKYEYAMYISNDIIVSSKFSETEDNISLETGEVFTKNNMMVTINNDILEYVY